MSEYLGATDAFLVAESQIKRFLEVQGVPVLVSRSDSAFVDILGGGGDVRFTAILFDKLIEDSHTLIPTVTNIDLGPSKHLGIGPKLLATWESVMTDFKYLGAQGVNNPRFWSINGYTPLPQELDFWIKMLV